MKTPFDLLHLRARADALLEECSRRRLGLEASMGRFLPKMARELGAVAAVVETKDEDLQPRRFSWGAGPLPASDALAARQGTTAVGGRLWVTRPLDVGGSQVGCVSFGFRDPAGRTDSAGRGGGSAGRGGGSAGRGVGSGGRRGGSAGRADALAEGVDAVAEELDDVVYAIHTAGVKQRIVERVGRLLTRRIFADAIDDAVVALAQAVPFDRFALVYADDERPEEGRLHYRVFRLGRLTHDGAAAKHPGLDRAVKKLGAAILEPGKGRVAAAMGLRGAVSIPLTAGIAEPRTLGCLVLSSEGGVSPFGRDLAAVFANAVTQRLVDFNRERRHLSQFFPQPVIDELLRWRDYERRFLAPRTARVGIFYADINSFTKVCERALRKPDRIGVFVDRWSAGVVDILWRNGGTFDKMVGDCVIGIFGPPFYRATEPARAQAALRTAIEVQEFTRRLESEPAYRSIAADAGLPGLGVAIGVSLCPVSVGLFGPNHDFTAFGRGMNETARLQSAAGFRETLVMEPAYESLRKAKLTGRMSFDGPREAKAKNVDKPLRFYSVKGR